MSGHPLLLVRVATRPFETLQALRGRRSVARVNDLLRIEGALAERAAALEEALYRLAGDRGSPSDAERARGRLSLVRLRRSVHNGRAPSESELREARGSLPADLAVELEEHAAALLRRADVERSCREACIEDLLRARSEVVRSVADPRVEEGIWLASRSLRGGIRRLAGRDPATWGHKERHLAGKALAYLARFCTKTSPNGLFCATALAEVDERGLTVLRSPEIARVDVLLNVAEARKVATCLAIDPAIDRAIVPRPNPTLSETDGGWTFWKPSSMRHPDDEEVHSRVKDHEVLRAFLEESATGERNVPALLEASARRCGAEAADVDAFYRQLVERGILIGEVELPYNSRRPLRELAEACRRGSCDPSWLPSIERVEEAVDEMPRLSGRERAETTEEIAGILEALPHNRPLKPDELLRLDAMSALGLRLPRAMLDEVRAGLTPYLRLFTAMYPERIYRSALAARFLEAFPADADVGLLDVYHGVFEPEDKHRPVAFPDPGRVAVRGSGTEEAADALRRARDLFARLAREAGPAEEVEIREDDLRAAVGGVPEPRWSCGVLFQVAAQSADHVARGDYRLVLSALFQGTGLALARFAHLLGGGLPPDRNPVVQELRRGWSCLERPGAIMAELTYNHNYRTANAGLRPSIFPHEIELPGEKASPGARVIPMRDLVVRWDTNEGRFVLRWPRTGDEVIPVINSGVNPVGVISFLINIGQQGLQPLGYFPGFSAKGITRWPRFVCGRTVLFRERWAFGPGEWPRPVRGSHVLDEADYFIEIGRWRRRHRIPRHVFVHSSADAKPRYLDLESPVFVELLQRSAAGAGREAPQDLEVTEMLPGPEHLWIEGEHGHHASEFLVHLQGPRPAADGSPISNWR